MAINHRFHIRFYGGKRSGDLKNTPLLKYVAQFKLPILVSTGGANMEDAICSARVIEKHFTLDRCDEWRAIYVVCG